MEDGARNPGSGEEGLAFLVGKESRLMAHPGADSTQQVGLPANRLSQFPEHLSHGVRWYVRSQQGACEQGECVLCSCTQAGRGAGVGDPSPSSERNHDSARSTSC